MIFDKLFETYMKIYTLVEHIVDTIPREVLGMSTSVRDLPDDAPYGFWVDRSGNFLQVKPFGHASGIDQIAHKTLKYLLDKGVKGHERLPYTYTCMFEMGWVRVVINNPSVVYEMGRKDRQLTQSQKKFLEFISEFYGLNSPTRDD